MREGSLVFLGLAGASGRTSGGSGINASGVVLVLLGSLVSAAVLVFVASYLVVWRSRRRPLPSSGEKGVGDDEID